MKLIGTITDKDIGEKNQKFSGLTSRKAARAILLNRKGEVAIMNVSKYNYHKLPGGGIENNENILPALERELKEETGAKVKITGELGRIIEKKAMQSQTQESYCFIADLESEGPQKFTENEKNAGFSLIWLPLEKAIGIFEKDSPEDYTGKFIRLRDLNFLKAFRCLQSEK